MAVTEYLDYSVDLSKEPSVITYSVPFVQGDKIAHTFRLTVLRDGSAASLSDATCAGAVIRSDDVQVGLTGTISGNVVTVPVPSAAYIVKGRVTIIIRLNTSTELRTVLMGSAFVEQGDAGSTVESTTTLNTVSSVLAQAQSVYNSIPSDYSAMSTKLATMEIATDSEAASYLG